MKLEHVAPDELFGASEPWRDLLTQADADRLFLSCDWQQLWWRSYAAPLAAEPLMFRMLDAAGGLAGIVPLYVRPLRRGGLLSMRTVEFVGSSWRDGSTMLTQYLAPVAHRELAPRVIAEVLKHLDELPEWDELVAGLTPRAGPFAQALGQFARRRGWGLREHDVSRAYHANLHDGFEHYLRRLSASSRRHLFNHRRRLAHNGSISFEVMTGAALSSAFDILNELHATRWGAPALSGLRRRFHEDLDHRSSGERVALISLLRCDGRPISALYDIRCGRRQYNIQMGFDERFDTSVSVGLLHLGYAMEHAWQQGVAIYDMLAGSGRRTQYKAALGDDHTEICTVQVLRAALPRLVYQFADGVRRRRTNLGH